MIKRNNRKCCIVYPEDSWKDNWDLIVSVILIFTCVITPFRLAFVEKDSIEWIWVNYTIDIIFAIDMLIIFNTAYTDENF